MPAGPEAETVDGQDVAHARWAAHTWTRSWAAAIPTSFVAVHAARYGLWIVDDAGINFSYARSIARGAGPVLQPGAAAVEGFSNPAWTLILVAGRWLRLFDTGTWFGAPDIVMFPKLLGLLACFGMFSCFHGMFSAIKPRLAVGLTIAAGSITAAVPSFVIWSMSGLENSLMAFSVVAIAAALVRAENDGRFLQPRTALLCGALAALAGLTRPDGALYLAAYPIAVLVLHRHDGQRAPRMVCASLGAALLPLAAYVGWRVATFGMLLPNTAVAKQQGLPSFAALNQATDVLGYVGWLGALLFIWFVSSGIRGSSATRDQLTLLLIPLGLALAAYTVLRPDWMTELRFTTPVWPIASMAFVVAAAEVLSNAEQRSRRLRRTAAIVVTSLLTLHLWNDRSNQYTRVPTVSVCAIARIAGYTFNSYADRLGIADGSLLAVDGGGTSLTTRLRFVDLSGLADARIARYWADNDMAGLRDHIFDEVRPTFIRIWSGWDGVAPSGILEDVRLRRDYALVWGPPEGGGNWVRRAAVGQVPDKLAQLQLEAPGLAEDVVAPFDRGAMLWWCGATLRPSQPGDDPLATMPE